MDICHLHVNARPPLNYCLAAPSGISKINEYFQAAFWCACSSSSCVIFWINVSVCSLGWLAAEYDHQRWCLQTAINWGQSIYSLHFMGQTPRMKLCEETDILREGTEYLTMSNHSSTWGSSHWTNDIKNIFDNAENCLVRFIWYTHDLRIQRAS